VEHYLSGYVAYLRFLQTREGEDPDKRPERADENPAAAPWPSSAAGPIVAWGGDVNLGRRQHYRTQQLGPASVLGGVPVLAEADLRIVNLECVVATRGEQGVPKGEGGPHYFRARPEMLRVLAEVGIDLVATANNHSGDYGAGALAEQAALLDAAGIGHAGSGPTLEAALAPALRRAGDLNVALFAIDATQPRFAAGEARAGNAYLPISSPSAWTACLAPRIAAVRAQAHVVLVAVHWGKNHEPAPGADEIAVGRAIIEAGADAVLGASAHVVQGVEIHKGRPIIHDAGDLLFDAIGRQSEDSDESGVFSLHLGTEGVRRVVFTPIETGFGRTVQLQGERAAPAVERFMRKSAALGARFAIAPDGQCALDLHPAARTPQPMPLLPMKMHKSDAEIRAVQQPREEWLAASVPAEAALARPLSLGPLRLLGARTTPAAIAGRGMLYVETFWQIDEATDVDWRFDIRAVPQSPATMPAWGAAMDHDPCDWMWPTSRWQPGRIYRDFHGLRPPAARRLHDAQLQLEIGLVGDADRPEPILLPGQVPFAVRPGRVAA